MKKITADEIIITNEDTLHMLDMILEKRDDEWWDRFYTDREKPVPFFHNIPDEGLVEFCASSCCKKGKALDVGCGNGRNALYLAKTGFNVIGIDFSQEAIRWATEWARDSDTKPVFLCKSLFDFEDKLKSFDFINDSGCFHHIKPHRREFYFEKILAYLKDDGFFRMTCFTTKGGADISDYDVYRDCSMHGGLGFSEHKLRSILETYFEIINFRQMNESDDATVFGKDFLWEVLMKKK